MIPYEVLEPVVARVRETGGRIAGYTHQWDESWCDQKYKNFLMASVETQAQKEKAQSKGWRTALTTLNWLSDRGFGDFLCPSTDEGAQWRQNEAFATGRRKPPEVTCETCGYCDGTRDGKIKTHRGVLLPVHGSDGREEAFRRHVG